MEALKSEYAPSQITVKQRIDRNYGHSDWRFGGEICVELKIKSVASSKSQNRVAMVKGDSDGGSFGVVSEFPTMQQCQSKFFKG